MGDCEMFTNGDLMHTHPGAYPNMDQTTGEWFIFRLLNNNEPI